MSIQTSTHPPAAHHVRRLIKRIRHIDNNKKEGYFEEVFSYHIVYYNSRLLFFPATITITFTTIILELLLSFSLGFGGDVLVFFYSWIFLRGSIRADHKGP